VTGSPADRPARLAQVLVGMAARLLPNPQRERYLPEWQAELEEYEREGIPPVPPALRILYKAPAVRHALSLAARTGGDLSLRQALSAKSFRYYFFGAICGELGAWVQNATLMFLAYQLAHSLLLVGMMFSALSTSTVVLGPWTAVASARFGGRRVVVGVRICGATTSITMAFIIFLVGDVSAWFLLTGAVLAGMTSAFSAPAESAIATSTLPEVHAETGRTASFFSANIGRAAGPLVAFFLIYFGGYGWAFLFASLASLATGAAITRSEPDFPGNWPERRSTFRDVTYIFMRDRSAVSLLAIAAVTAAAIMAPLILGSELAAKSAFPIDSYWFFLAALGAGASLVSFRPARKPSLRKIAIYLEVLCAAAIGFAFSPIIWLSLAAAVIMGSASMLTSASVYALCAGYMDRSLTAAMTAVWAVVVATAGFVASLFCTSFALVAGIRADGALLAAPAFIAAILIVKYQRSARVPSNDQG
jgi:predicted MFS family arabinose efflux permease